MFLGILLLWKMLFIKNWAECYILLDPFAQSNYIWCVLQPQLELKTTKGKYVNCSDKLFNSFHLQRDW